MSKLTLFKAATLFAISMMGAPAHAGGALNSCEMWQLTGQGPMGGPNTVVAWCKTMTGRVVTTSAWLPHYLGNRGGTLVIHRDGFYDRTCRTFNHLNWWHLQAHCQRPNKSLNYTQISLNFLTNHNGRLGW